MARVKRKQVRRQRWLYVLLLALLIGWLVYCLLQVTKLHQQARNDKFSQHSQQLSYYPAQRAIRLLQAEDNDGLKRLVDDVSHHPMIVDAVIYDVNGVVLAQSDNAVPLDAILPLATSTTAMPGTTPYLTPLSADGKNLGFLRLTLSWTELFGVDENFSRDAAQLWRYSLLAALFIGILLARLLSRKRLLWQLHPRQHKARWYALRRAVNRGSTQSSR